MPTATLADVGRSAAAAVGVPGFRDVLGIGECRHVVVCLIDGLGWQSLREHPDLAPAMSGLGGAPIEAVFPTTTSVGMGSLGTGLMPGTHGLVGASFLLPELHAVLNPLHWGGSPTPVAVQPEPTVFEAVARAGVTMTSVSPAAYRDSGLTRAVLRGADYVGAEDLAERLAAVRTLTASASPTYTYVYWSELDRVGHEFGVASPQWRAALQQADALVAGLAATLPAGSALVVTADHGMVDCPPDERIAIDERPHLLSGVELVAGEPRARHLYVRPGAAEDVQATWQHEAGDRAVVLRREQLVEQGYFGEVDEVLADRIGDVMAIATGTAMFASRTDRTVSRLLGQHGALTPDELLIPALVHRTS